MAELDRNSSKDHLENLVRAYFIQLTQGCGNEQCGNPNCVTGGKGEPLDANQAAALAVVLAKERKEDVCVPLQNGIKPKHVCSKNVPSPKKDVSPESTASGGSGYEPMEVEPSQPASPSTSIVPSTSKNETPKGLTEPELLNLLSCAKDNPSSHKQLKEALWNTFTNPAKLNSSFLKETKSAEDSIAVTVDIHSVRKVYSALFETEMEPVTNTLVNAMDVYCSSMKQGGSSLPSLNHIVILFENPLLHSPEFLETAFPRFLSVVATLSIDQKADLVNWYSHYPVETISRFLSNLQQLITISALQTEDSSSKAPFQSNPTIASATHVMMIFYIANLVIAKRQKKTRPHSERLLSTTATPLPKDIQLKTLNVFEMLLLRCSVHPAECYQTPISLSEFVNEYINNDLEMLPDYRRQNDRVRRGRPKISGKSFCFLDHPYILDTANKVEKLYYDNQLSMISERQRTLFNTLLTGVVDIPFLLLRVDRNDIVNDTLAQLEVQAELNPTDLRKQLRVEFKDEEGIDEGGVQKEFFQLLVERLFDPLNGMFLQDEENHFQWFNSGSLESEKQYYLIGILLGLAIYNNVILDVRFPQVVYHKLLGCQTTPTDLESSHPQIFRSLKFMLELASHEDDEFEKTFMSTFTVSYRDMYSCQQTILLKKNGDKTPVTRDNVQEFVDLYADWLLNKSIEVQFNEFKKGFDIVMGESNMADLFTAEELELLICGSKEWDFNSLEENTQYDGFTKSHDVIRNFWEIFYEFSDEQKKQFLAFVTGSDRVPVGGLSKLKMVIVKNGPDSDRLPTAHTCFNALLLCTYSSKEKLKERLEKAMENGQGFGML